MVVENVLSSFSDQEFDEELTRRIARVSAAWEGLQATFGPHLGTLAGNIPTMPHNSQDLWREQEASEKSLAEGFEELARRKAQRGD